MQGVSGIEVIEGIRGWSRLPIVVLSVRDTEADKVAALDAGADDYVTKPFGMDELLAVSAALRRVIPVEEEPVIETADFTIDLAAKRVIRNGEEVRLTPTEWQLVEVLVRNRGKLVPNTNSCRRSGAPRTATKRATYASTSPGSDGSSSQNTRGLDTSRPRPGSGIASTPPSKQAS